MEEWLEAIKSRLRPVKMREGEYFRLEEWDWLGVGMELCMIFLGEQDSSSLARETDFGKGYRASVL